jgi:hypothetical protein
VIQLLRFIGLANAGVWFGAAVFVTFFGGPAFFSDEMVGVLQHKYYVGLAAQVFLKRYFLLHYLCAAVALAHLLFEWFYLGRRLSRFGVGVWIFVTVLALAGGVGLQPKLRQLHQLKYTAATPAAQAAAANSFGAWHAVSQVGNLLVLLGLAAFFWRTAFPPLDFPRYGKFRG